MGRIGGKTENLTLNRLRDEVEVIREIVRGKKTVSTFVWETFMAGLRFTHPEAVQRIERYRIEYDLEKRHERIRMQAEKKGASYASPNLGAAFPGGTAGEGSQISPIEERARTAAAALPIAQKYRPKAPAHPHSSGQRPTPKQHQKRSS